jgi:hypothetical protein
MEYAYEQWFKLVFLIAVACIFLADVSFPRDVAIFNLVLLCIVEF